MKLSVEGGSSDHPAVPESLAEQQATTVERKGAHKDGRQ